MTAKMTASRRENPRRDNVARGALAVIGLAFGLCGCVSDGPAPAMTSLQAVETAPTQPRTATYNCGDDGSITVEAMPSAVRLVEAEGSSYELPASPPTQSNRFGEGNVALVVEDGEALWMKAGREPVTCRR
jgi:hypothetical protein